MFFSQLITLSCSLRNISNYKQTQFTIWLPAAPPLDITQITKNNWRLNPINF